VSTFATAVAAMNAVQLATFGEVVSYTRFAPTQLTTAPRVIWIEGEQVATRKPGAAAIATVRLSDFTVAPVKGDEVTRGGVLYRVSNDPRNDIDGLGLMCDLVLRKV